MSVHFSSNNHDWETPQELYDSLHKEFRFNLDPCATHQNAKCDRYFTRKQDGLRQSWAKRRVFMNPPYGREIGKWVKKAHEEAKKGALVVCLIPARTDTSYWHDYIHGKTEIRFLRGRVHFSNGGPAPFPSAVVIFRPAEPFTLANVAGAGKPAPTTD